MDMLLNRLNPKAQSIVNVTTSAIGAIACLVLAWFSFKLTLDHFQIGHAFIRFLEVPSYPILAVIPFGSFLLFIQFIRRMSGYLRSRKALEGKD